MAQNEEFFDFTSEAPAPEPETEIVQELGPLVPEVIQTLPAIPVPKMDITPLALNLVPFEHKVAVLKQEARAIVVRDASSQKAAVSAEAVNIKLNKKLEAARKAAVQPYNEHVKTINNLFHVIQDVLEGNISFLKAERGKYDHQLLLEQRRKDAELREANRKLQEAVDAEARAQREDAARKAQEAAEKLKTEEDEEAKARLQQTVAEETAASQAPTPIVEPVVSERPAMVRTGEGSSYTKFKWVGKIIDPDKVPRDCCEPSQKLINAKVDAGIRHIDGCVIEEIPIPVTRV